MPFVAVKTMTRYCYELFLIVWHTVADAKLRLDIYGRLDGFFQLAPYIGDIYT